MKTLLRLVRTLAMCGGAFTALAQPANDNFASATTLAASGGTVWGSLANATSEAGEPLREGISSGQTAWWTWTAPLNGIVTLAVNGTNFSPLLTVYTGNELAALSLVASNNYLMRYEHEECGTHWRFRNQAVFHVTQGQAYRIAVDSAILTDASWVWGASQSPVPPLQPTVEESSAIVVNQLTREDSSGAADGSLQLPEGSARDAYERFLLLIAARQNYLYAWTVVQTTNIVAGGDIGLGLQFTPAPVNDDFDRSILLSGLRKNVRVSNFGAGKEAGEPDHLGRPGGSSVWYSWQAPASGRVTLSINELQSYGSSSWSFGFGSVSTITYMLTCGREIDLNPLPKFFPIFAAYTGSSVDGLSSPNCMPVGLAAYPYAAMFDAVKGETYRIVFDGNQGTTGDTSLYLTLTQPASNDLFARRIRLRGIGVVANGFNAGATFEVGEPLPPAGCLGKSVWWSWKAPVSGTVSIDLSRSDDPAMAVAVYSGGTLASLEFVAGGEGGVAFEAVAGQVYQISVSDHAGYTGGIVMYLQAPVVDLELVSVRSKSPRKAVLEYRATKGQRVLLLRGEAGRWTSVRTALARRDLVSFSVKPAPDALVSYRAIVVDLLP